MHGLGRGDSLEAPCVACSMTQEEVSVRDVIGRAIGASPADYTDVRIERRAGTSIELKKGKVDGFESYTESGGIVRCLTNGGWGIAVFNDLSELDGCVDEAARVAEIVARDVPEPAVLASVPTVQDIYRAEIENDFRAVPLSRKIEVLKSYHEVMAQESKRIVSADVHYNDGFRETTFASSEGSYIIQELPDITITFVVTAGDGKDDIQKGFESFGHAGGFDIVLGHEDKAREVARRAVAMLDAPVVKAGQHTVILDPVLAGAFIHEAFGHQCEADFLHQNPRMAEIMTLGTEFGAPELNVVDEGFLPGMRGNVPYDDEGVRRDKTYLLKHGRLHSLLHSRETAAKMGAKPTGNGRAIGYEYRPIVRMTNTYIEGGDDSFEEMLRGIDQGVYAKAFYGGQTKFEQFSFSALYAYEIVDGELGGLLRNVVLSGNLFETMKAIDAIGNDQTMFSGDAGCGKNGQNGLAAPPGSPHIRIRNVTIGGP